MSGVIRKKNTGNAWETVLDTGGGGGSQTLAQTLALGNDGSGTAIVNIGAPSNAGDAATKGYADAMGQTAGGDLSGTFPNPVVATVNGHTLGTTLSAGAGGGTLVAGNPDVSIASISTFDEGTWIVFAKVYGAAGGTFHANFKNGNTGVTLVLVNSSDSWDVTLAVGSPDYSIIAVISGSNRTVELIASATNTNVTYAGVDIFAVRVA